MKCLKLVPLLGVWLTLNVSSVLAQGSGGSSGVQTITPTTTSSASTAGGGASRSTSTSGSGSTFGGSSTGASATGRQQTGTTTGGLSQPQFQAFGQAGQSIGTGFVGRGNTDQTFVGQQQAGRQTIDAGGAARFTAGNGEGISGTQSTTSQTRGSQIRVPQRIAFATPPITPPVVQASIETQFAGLGNSLPGVRVATEESGHVRLEGLVESEHARRLAEALVRLKPGVRTVTNALEVDVADAGPRLP